MQVTMKIEGREDARSLILYQVQLVLGQVHVNHPIAVPGGAGHGHDVSGIPAPWKVIRPESRPSPSEIHLGNGEALSRRHNESRTILGPAGVYLSQARHGAVGLHPVDQAQEVVLGGCCSYKVVDLSGHPIQWAADEVVGADAAEGNGEHISEVGLHSFR